jgi:hypothetical protein
LVAAPLPAATRPPLLQATGLTARQAQPSGQPACQPLHMAPAAGAPEPMGATLLPAAVRAPRLTVRRRRWAAAPARTTPAAPAEPAVTAKTPRRA